MANNYSVKVDADISNYNSNIDSATDATKKFQDAADDANKAVEDIGKKGARSTKELLDEMKNLEKGGRSVSNYRKQLSKLQRDISDLTINYRAMSDEMKNSDIGRETVLRISELTKEAANYRDAIGDAQQAIRQLSSDTFAFDAAAQGIDLMSSALQTYISFGLNSADTTEKLSKVLGKLKMAEQGAATAIKVLNMLNKDTGVIMQAVGNIQLAAATKAAKLAQSTNKATIAQKAFNLVAKANPYVLLASAIATLVVGIGAYIAITNRASSASQEAARATKNFNKALEEGKKEANETAAKFIVLQSEWKSLKTEGEKTEWLKENQDRFKELGLNINDVNDAEKAFVKYSANIIEAMALRAQAAKLAAEAEKEMEKALNNADKAQSKAENAGNDFMGLTKKDIKKYGLIKDLDFKEMVEIQNAGTDGEMVRKWFELTPDGNKKLHDIGVEMYKEIEQGGKDRIQPIIDKINKLRERADKLENPLGSVKKDTQDTANATQAAADSLKAAEDKLSKMQAEFHAMGESDPGLGKMKQDVIEQEKLVERLRKKYDTIKKGGEQVVAHNSRLSQLGDELTALNKIEPSLKEGTKEWDAHYKRVAEIEKEVKDLEGAIEAYKKRIMYEKLDLKPVVTNIELPKTLKVPVATILKQPSNEELRDFYDKIADKASVIQKDFDLGLISPKAAQIMIDSLNNQLKAKGITAEVGIDFHVDETEVKSKIQSIVDDFDGFSNMANGIVGSMNDIYESVSSLGDKLDEAESGWESFFAVFQTGMTIFQSFTTLLETFDTIMGVVNALRGVGVATTEADTQATKRNTKEKIKNAGATAAEAIAAGTNSAASIPMVGWAVALAAGAALLAMLLGAMKSAKGFAGGGIPGNSFHGDKIPAWVNSGEMILNQKQQAHLFKLLDSGNANNGSGGQVEFKINGTQLVGVLNNINRKNSNI